MPGSRSAPGSPGAPGPALEASDQSLLTAYAAHFAVLEERRRAQADAARTQELAEGNRTKTALLAAVSHDLRTPLAAIKAASSSLRNTAIAWSEEDREELLATVEESADRLDALVANLLDMSRLQTGSITSSAPRSTWPGGGVDAAGRARGRVDRGHRTRRPAAGVRRSGSAGAGDRQRGRERAQAHRRQGRSRCRCPPGRDRVGPAGQPAGGRPGTRGAGGGPGAIFEPFQRLGDVPAGDGVGLGLAVARGLMEAMNGTVAAEPTPGGGLTVVIDLPAATINHPLHPTATGS